jgi:hypothetical protein
VLLSLGNNVEELSEIVHRGRNDYLIIRTATQLENRHSDEVTNDLGINSDDMATNSGLKYQPLVIVLHHLYVGIEKSDKPGVDNTGTGVKIPPMISLDSVMNTIQRCHHNVRVDYIPLGND